MDLNPTKGSEIPKKRPVIVISNTLHHEKTGQMIVLPITNTDKSYPLDIPLSRFDGKGNNKKIKGVILLEQIRSLDIKVRNFEFIEFASDEDLLNIKRLLVILFEDLLNH